MHEPALVEVHDGHGRSRRVSGWSIGMRFSGPKRSVVLRTTSSIPSRRGSTRSRNISTAESMNATHVLFAAAPSKG